MVWFGLCRLLYRGSLTFYGSYTRYLTTTTRFKMLCKPKVIVDTDPGTDDAVALFMVLEAHRRNLIELVAITTVNGNSTIDNININMFRILEVAQMTHIPVYPGASKGLVSTFTFPEVPFHGYDGFSDVIKDPPPPSLSLLQKESASLALVRLVEENPGEIIMLAIGPLTNLAIAINICPDWTSKLRDFYIMGGNVSGVGNVTLMAEFNFACDPEAAKVVLERATLPIKLTPWETCCYSVHISYEERDQLGSTNTPAANLLNAIEALSRKQKRYNKWITCDQLCIVWFLHDYAKAILRDDVDSEKFVTKSDSFYATVEVSGHHSRGQMVIDHKERLKLSPNIVCMREINKDLYMKYLKLAFQ